MFLSQLRIYRSFLICDDTFIFINLFFILSRMNHPFIKGDPNEIKTHNVVNLYNINATDLIKLKMLKFIGKTFYLHNHLHYSLE